MFLSSCQEKEASSVQVENTANTSVSLPESSATETILPAETPVQPSPIPSETLALTEVLTPTALPESYRILGISGHEQVYPLGCEASAAVDLAAFHGYMVYESEFQAALPVSDNPDYGFVGASRTERWGQIPPYAYGVHAGPVADLLLQYGIPAESWTDMTLDELKAKIVQNKPVIVWVIGNMEYSVPITITDSLGRQAVVAPFEHVVIVTGYGIGTIRYMNNGRFYDVPTDVFLKSWGVLGNLAVALQ